MSTNFIYKYPKLIRGKLIRRYKRFLADIELSSGEIITAHCANTGPMTGVCTPSSPVYVSKSNNPKRKLAYTWEMIQVKQESSLAPIPPAPLSEGVKGGKFNETWVGINTSLPNHVVKLALEQQIFPELVGLYTQIRCEVPYGKDSKSRIDFFLTGDKSPIYLEVKNTTLAEDNLAMFPDTVTTRGQKHLRELMALLPQAKPVMLYFINRGDCPYFAPGDHCDPTYGQLLRQAIKQGVTILPYRFQTTPEGIRYLGLAKLITHR